MKHLLLTTIAVVLLLGCKSLQSPGPPDVTQIKPRIVNPLEFVGLTVSSLGDVRDVNNLFHEKLSMGGQDGHVFLRLDHDDDESYVPTETVAQYMARVSRGAGAMTTYDITMDGFFEATLPTLLFLKESKPSKFSLISDDLLDLPVSILPWAGSEERIRHQTDGEKGMTLRDYYKQGRITKVEKEPYGIRFEIPDRFVVYYSENARGDYDRDGYEDLQIFKLVRYMHGSGFYFGSHIVHRDDSSRIAVINNYYFNPN